MAQSKKTKPSKKPPAKPALPRTSAAKLSPSQVGNSTPLAIRIPDDLLDLLDAEILRLKDELPGLNLGRSDIIRSALYKYLKPKPEEKKA